MIEFLFFKLQVFVNKQCRLKPPVEELRTAYFKEIKNFIQLPVAFKGLEGAAHIYKAMPDRNPQSVMTVFAKAEELFQQIQAVADGQLGDFMVFVLR